MGGANKWLRVSKKEHLLWCSQWFAANPKASVDDCARAAYAAQVPLHKGDISRVRRGVLESILEEMERTSGAITPTVVEVKPRLEPKRSDEELEAMAERLKTQQQDRKMRLVGPETPGPIEVHTGMTEAELRRRQQKLEAAIARADRQLEEAAKAEAEANATQLKRVDEEFQKLTDEAAAPSGAAKFLADVQSAPPELEASKEDPRVAYVRERLEAEPGIHPDFLVAEMRQKFQHVLDRVALYDLCRAARDKHGLPQLSRRNMGPRRQQGASVDEHIQELTREFIQGLKDAGYRFDDFTLAFNAEWEVEFTYELRRASQGKMKL